MKRNSLALACVTAMTSLFSIGSAMADPYIERNGTLFVEVESQPAEGDWSFQSDITGFNGNGFLTWNGSNNYRKSEALRGNPITYRFRINNAGNYELRWRSRNTVGLDATEHNDSWVRFPTGKNIQGQHGLDGWTKAYMGQVARWTWDAYTVDNNNQPIRQYFDAGDHYLEISGRSRGHGLDRFALFQYEQHEFDMARFDTRVRSPRLSELALDAHTHSANTCRAGVLSIAAQNARANGTARVMTIDAQDPATLRFALPNVAFSSATLKLASTQGNVALSAYLGSHANWDQTTATQDLPEPGTLLVRYQADAVMNTIQSLAIEPSMLSGDAISLILTAEPGDAQALHARGSLSEPRLELSVADSFCMQYQMQRTEGTNGDVHTGHQTDTDGSDDGAATIPADPDQQLDTTQADTSGTTADNPSGDEFSPPASIEPLAQTAPVSRSGGAVSTVTLAFLALMSVFYRTREKRLREFCSRR